MMYQRSALRHRVVPPSMRYHPTQSRWRLPRTSPWYMIWIAASILVLLVIGVLLGLRG